MKLIILVLSSILISYSAFSANTLTRSVLITTIDATSYSGDIKVQLFLYFSQTKAIGSTVSISADNIKLTGSFYELSRIVFD